MNRVYLGTARLLTTVAPLVRADETSALKGGTAISLFVRDMPRLSVDLDLVLPDRTLPLAPALERINAAIHQSAARLKKQGVQTHASISVESGAIKLLVRQGTTEVKIEVNSVLRGAVHRVRMASLTPHARNTPQVDLEIPVVSPGDAYGSKLIVVSEKALEKSL